AAAAERPAGEAVAVIGMSGRFPLAADLAAFWDNLVAGRDCIGEIPKQRWDWRALYGDPSREANKTNIKWGGFIEGVDEFDPLFFGISPREAELMDPQQRLLMMYVWKAIEDAGYSAASLAGSRTALLVGTASSGYVALAARAAVALEGYSATGMVPSVGPNRMSYFLDLHGPSEPIETACSSSLVAVHRAMQALASDSCELAIAGGINTLLTPEAYISFSKAGMLSADGRCKTFSRHANGYVRGEGVGMLVLKKLEAAQADGDHIYGVIRGSAENHGGRAQSLTAPNPKAQAELLKAAYRQAGIDPGSVGYIEAHGTGTALGDPIEINGLKAAFKQLSANGGAAPGTGTCGLGSVKTNIGHLELAAGMAGMIKVLLQLQHKTLVKSLHGEEINPYIELADSPFYIVQERRAWEPIHDASGRALPRRAGVSSFGFGGVNAHIVIEEYVAPERPPVAGPSAERPAIIVLSAKNEDRLRERVEQLLSAIERGLGEADLADVAYTLQVGREAMEARLGVIAASMTLLKQKLQAWLAAEPGIEDLYRGQLKREKDALAVFAADEELQEAVAKWVERGKYGKLLELWVKGLAVDWSTLYGAAKPRRISLPTYPFARERYWVPEPVAAVAGVGPPVVLHPLLHENTSDLSGQRFRSRLSGEEFFLSDHVVQGRRVLPGAAYLEMARAAVAKSVGEASWDGGLELKNVAWLRPIVVGEDAEEVSIELVTEDGGEIGYQIYSCDPASEASEAVLRSHGRAVLRPASAAPLIDIAALRAQCQQRTISGEECYEALRRMGLSYGAAHRSVDRLLTGADRQQHRQVLAQLVLPDCVADGGGQYVLHPSVLDGALQASLGLEFGGTAEGRVFLPFAVEQVRIFAASPARGWAWVRYAAGSVAGDAVRKLDIDLCDEQGRVSVQLCGFSTRAVEEGLGQTGTLLLERAWRAQAVEEVAGFGAGQHWVVLCEPNEAAGQAAGELEREIAAALPGVRCVTIRSEAAGIAARYEAAIVELLATLQAIVQEQPKQEVLLQLLVAAAGEGGLFAGLSGVLKTARLEHPKLLGQVIGLEAGEALGSVVAKLRENASAPQDDQVRYRSGERQVAGWAELAPSPPGGVRWRDRGVYLLTGGAGGLGLIFAREIAARVQQPRLILTGRSQPSAAQAAEFAALEAAGARVCYRQLDVADAAAVSRLVAELRQEFGSLEGIVHGAGVIRDSLLLKKTAAEVAAVLAPKVAGIVNLDAATRDVALDFMVLFASGAGALGNVGQADYAAANAFLDGYAAYRNEQVRRGERRGQTLSVDWPLWRDGGMQVDAAVLQLQQRRGIVPLPTAQGIAGFYAALASGRDQVLVLSGEIERLRAAVARKVRTAGTPERTIPAGDRTGTPVMADDMLEDKALRFFKKALSSVIKLPVDRIEADAALEQYGIDSLIAMQLTAELEESFGSLPKTLLFEYQNIKALAEYFLDTYRDRLTILLGLEERSEEPVLAQAMSPALLHRPVVRNRRSTSLSSIQAATSNGRAAERLEIAIIGVSGCYPQAGNLDE
ncbi:MAG: polyketide synthase PksN, partial [Alphaproteobacteria bacterium]|nr:polyketide synthase PksN [Alphaproteobacteria bacterium]